MEYEYKGAMKLAAYYVGQDDLYIAVLTADDAAVLSGVNKVQRNAIIILSFFQNASKGDANN